MKIPHPLYPCKFCFEYYSWPPEDLWWSDTAQGFVCDNCWDEQELEDDVGPSLVQVIEDRERETT